MCTREIQAHLGVLIVDLRRGQKLDGLALEEDLSQQRVSIAFVRRDDNGYAGSLVACGVENAERRVYIPWCVS